MRLLIILLTIVFFGSNGLVGLQLLKNFNDNETNTKKKIDAKIITITIEISEHLNIQNKYYLKILNSKISMINLINALNISNFYFDILALNLNQSISEDYKLALLPRSNAIRYYSRYNITLAPLINLGLNNIATKKVLFLFNNKKLTSKQLLENLEKLLIAKKRKYIKLMHKFISF
ncbi:hypothetical protein [Spiroplasma endosymbiont of Polydrusus pterygomalis]|uniref:hypothetical protein n=1 Tax=Spiroplasma endosymbiont of Polydrusus pterygomalis TaxID=3139327 RepID=UPI003CCAC3F9